MSLPVKIAIAGAEGRMGKAVALALEGRADAAVVARFDRPGAEGGYLVSRDQALEIAEAVIDFTLPEASVQLAEAAARRGGPALVIGSTGFSDEQLVRLEEAAAALPAEDWDIEVFEAHHKRKIDAPSGTALMLGEAAAEGRGVDLAKVADRGRDGVTGPRVEGAIGFSVVRGGGIIGEHSVIFAGESETLTLAHSAIDRGLFARGAIAAAVWVKAKPPGLYDMQDMLGFSRSDVS